MRAVVLVGGEGTRLRPLTWTVPKPLLPVAGLTMIERVVGRLAAFGVDEVVLSMGYRPDAFQRAFGDDRICGMPLRYEVEPEPLDTAGAVRFAASRARVDDTFLVVNGDVLTDLDVGALVGFHRDRGAQATISLTPVEDPSAFGVVPTDADGRVTDFIEKPPRDEAPTNLINAGTYVLEPSVLDLIEPGRRVSIERVTFPRLVKEGRLFALASDTYWMDTGTPDKYLRACLDYLEGRRGSEPVRGIGRECRFGAGSDVSSSVLGDRVTVGEGAVVRGSVLLDGVTVGPQATVDGSIVGARSTVGAGSKVTGLSVVGCDVEMPEGSVLDGGRLPEVGS